MSDNGTKEDTVLVINTPLSSEVVRQRIQKYCPNDVDFTVEDSKMRNERIVDIVKGSRSKLLLAIQLAQFVAFPRSQKST